jgi:hypothetical protein
MSSKLDKPSSELHELADTKSLSQTGSITADLPAEDEFRRREKSLVRKLDLTLIPIVWVLYMFNYLDRNNIAYDTSFVEELHLSSSGIVLT